MILSTLKKLNKTYKDTGFSHKYIFLLSFVTSLTLSIFEGFFLGVIFNLTSNLLGKTYQTINFFENSIFDFQNLNEILILCAAIIIFITLIIWFIQTPAMRFGFSYLILNFFIFNILILRKLNLDIKDDIKDSYFSKIFNIIFCTMIFYQFVRLYSQ